MIMNDVDNYYLKLHIATQLYMKSSFLFTVYTHSYVKKKQVTVFYILCVHYKAFYCVNKHSKSVRNS